MKSHSVEMLLCMPLLLLLFFYYYFFRRLKSKETGYIPANYVKEIEARLVRKTTKQKVLVPEKVKVKKKVKKKVKVQKQRLVAADKLMPEKSKQKKGELRVKENF